MVTSRQSHGAKRSVAPSPSQTGKGITGVGGFEIRAFAQAATLARARELFPLSCRIKFVSLEAERFFELGDELEVGAAWEGVVEDVELFFDQTHAPEAEHALVAIRAVNQVGALVAVDRVLAVARVVAVRRRMAMGAIAA